MCKNVMAQFSPLSDSGTPESNLQSLCIQIGHILGSFARSPLEARVRWPIRQKSGCVACRNIHSAMTVSIYAFLLDNVPTMV